MAGGGAAATRMERSGLGWCSAWGRRAGESRGGRARSCGGRAEPPCSRSRSRWRLSGARAATAEDGAASAERSAHRSRRSSAAAHSLPPANSAACAMAAGRADKGCGALALSHPPLPSLTSHPHPTRSREAGACRHGGRGSSPARRRRPGGQGEGRSPACHREGRRLSGR
jgi:hypothetical protein